MLAKRFVLAVVAVLLLGGCVGSPTKSNPLSSQPIQLKQSPNWDYIAFSNLLGYPNDPGNAGYISNAIAEWETNHPDRKIVSLQIIQQQPAYVTSAQVMGISIYSEKVP